MLKNKSPRDSTSDLYSVGHEGLFVELTPEEATTIKGGSVDSVFLEGQTDSTGRFQITHDYLAEPSSCEGTFIAGATVAIRNSGNNEWYTLVDRNENEQAIAWGDRKVSGYFNQPGFENQPVRVVLFLTNRIC